MNFNQIPYSHIIYDYYFPFLYALCCSQLRHQFLSTYTCSRVVTSDVLANIPGNSLQRLVINHPTSTCAIIWEWVSNLLYNVLNLTKNSTTDSLRSCLIAQSFWSSCMGVFSSLNLSKNVSFNVAHIVKCMHPYWTYHSITVSFSVQGKYQTISMSYK